MRSGQVGLGHPSPSLGSPAPRAAAGHGGVLPRAAQCSQGVLVTSQYANWDRESWWKKGQGDILTSCSSL